MDTDHPYRFDLSQLAGIFGSTWVRRAATALSLLGTRGACVLASGVLCAVVWWARPVTAVSEPAAEQSLPGSARDRLAELSLRDVTITFFSLRDPSGQRMIALREQGSAYASSSPLAELAPEGLTSLELYFALAPVGSEPPVELREAHALEAARLRRDAEVRRVRLGNEPVVHRFRSCSSAMQSHTSSWSGAGKWGSPTTEEYVEGSHGFRHDARTRAVVLGLCNDGSTESLLATQGFLEGDQRVFHATTDAIAPKSYHIWYYVFALTPPCSTTRTLCVGDCVASVPDRGLCSPASAHGAEYRIDAQAHGAYVLAQASWPKD